MHPWGQYFPASYKMLGPPSTGSQNGLGAFGVRIEEEEAGGEFSNGRRTPPLSAPQLLSSDAQRLKYG